jgi:translation initiation factor 4E
MDSLQHPLEREWRVWFTPAVRKPPRGHKGPSVDEPPSDIGYFRTIEFMWRYMNNLPEPGKLAIGANMYIFESDVKPSWEDPGNIRGGRWTFSIDRAESADETWKTIYLMLFGETLDPDKQIVGIALARRRLYTRISVWTRDRENDVATLAIGKILKAELARPSIEYQDHGAEFESYRHVI